MTQTPKVTTRTDWRMKWIWTSPHQTQLVNKASQMVRDEWTETHFIGCQKNKMTKCVFAAAPLNRQMTVVVVWGHYSGFGQLLVRFMNVFTTMESSFLDQGKGMLMNIQQSL